MNSEPVNEPGPVVAAGVEGRGRLPESGIPVEIACRRNIAAAACDRFGNDRPTIIRRGAAVAGELRWRRTT